MKAPYYLVHKSKYNNDIYLIQNEIDLINTYYSIFRSSMDSQYYWDIFDIEKHPVFDDYFNNYFKTVYQYNYSDYLACPKPVRDKIGFSDEKQKNIKKTYDEKWDQLQLIKLILNKNIDMSLRKRALIELVESRRFHQYEAFEKINLAKPEEFK